MSARDELAELLAVSECPNLQPPWREREDRSPVKYFSRKLADAILAAGYSRPRTITSADELDALPVGSVVLSAAYRHHATHMQVAFQRWDDGLWHRGGRAADTHPDNFVPATVLYEPAP